jgi:hypothetical protein
MRVIPYLDVQKADFLGRSKGVLARGIIAARPATVALSTEKKVRFYAMTDLASPWTVSVRLLPGQHSGRFVGSVPIFLNRLIEWRSPGKCSSTSIRVGPWCLG